MNISATRFSLYAAGCGLALLLAGCATPRIDWNARLGNYTYDHAILELGPPDRLATLTDGAIVAEWLTSRGRAHGTIHTFGPPYPHYFYGGPMVYHYMEPPSRDYFIRLMFSPDGILQSWQRVMR
jgi:hypothetical protein